MQSSIPLWIVAPLFLVGGVLLLVGAVKAARDEHRFLVTAVRTQGVVEDLVYSRAPKTNAGFPVVRFTTLKGTTITATSRATRTGYRLGQEVSILYDPDDPSHVEIEAWWARWAGTAGLAFFAAVCIGAAVAAVLAMLKVNP